MLFQWVDRPVVRDSFQHFGDDKHYHYRFIVFDLFPFIIVDWMYEFFYEHFEKHA